MSPKSKQLKRLSLWAPVVLATILSFASLSGAKAADLSGKAIGAVVMHGKGGAPSGLVKSLADALSQAGVMVENPLMPWGKDRIYDKTYEESLVEISGYVRKLREKGAKRVVVIGHSIGGNAAIGYGGTYDDVDGIIALAPGHHPESPVIQKKVGPSVQKAKVMIDADKGNSYARFKDFNIGEQADANVTANIYYSWFSPTGPARISAYIPNLKGMPLLWIDGSRDRLSKIQMRTQQFGSAPPHPLTKYEIVEADHAKVPDASIDLILKWLDQLE